MDCRCETCKAELDDVTIMHRVSKKVEIGYISMYLCDDCLKKEQDEE